VGTTIIYIFDDDEEGPIDPLYSSTNVYQKFLSKRVKRLLRKKKRQKPTIHNDSSVNETFDVLSQNVQGYERPSEAGNHHR
jgi:hypothetical protein